MIAADLAYGRRVVWRGLSAEIVDVIWSHRVTVWIRVAGGKQFRVTPDELTEVYRCR